MQTRRPRLRRGAPEEEAAAPTPATALQPTAVKPATGALATSGPGPVGGADPDTGPRPPITGSHPIVGPAPGTTEAQRVWLAQIDRKLGTRTYAGAAALVLSMAIAIVAIVLAIDARDNTAAEDDLTRVESQLEIVSEQAATAETSQSDIADLQSRLSTLEDQIVEIQSLADTDGSRVDVIEDDLNDLRREVSAIDSIGAGAATGPGADATP